MKAILGIGIALAVSGVVVYLWQQSRRRTSYDETPIDPIQIKTVWVESLGVEDIVQFFKSLELNANQDSPFVCTDSEIITKCVKIPEIEEGTTLVILGSHNKLTDKVDYLQLVVATTLTDDFVEMMGGDKLVLLT